MNVNDVICVGAEPLAMIDYIAIEHADPRSAQRSGGLARGAELAGVEIPGGELAQLGGLVRGFDLAGACFGVVGLDAAVIDGGAIEPGDPVIGLPSSGLHSNGYTLARRALDGMPLDDDRLGEPLGDLLLRPTEIYVRAVMDLLASPAEVRGLAHITSGGLGNLLRMRAEVGYRIDEPLPGAADLRIDPGARAEVSDEEMDAVFNLGCGFCCVVATAGEGAALEALRRATTPPRGAIGAAVEGPRELHGG